MAEKSQQTKEFTRRDEEMTNSDDLKRKKRIKCGIYIAIFVVFQIIVITVFGLFVMRAKSPKLRLSKDFEFQKLDTVSTSPASFDMRLATQVRVKNPNLWPYKFQNTTVTFSHGGAAIGRVVIPEGKVGIRSTKKVNALVNLNSKGLTNTRNLGSELSTGALTLSSTARVIGKVELMFIMKKNKSGIMNCTIVIDVRAKNIKSLACK